VQLTEVGHVFSQVITTLTLLLFVLMTVAYLTDVLVSRSGRRRREEIAREAVQALGRDLAAAADDLAPLDVLVDYTRRLGERVDARGGCPSLSALREEFRERLSPPDERPPSPAPNDPPAKGPGCGRPGCPVCGTRREAVERARRENAPAAPPRPPTWTCGRPGCRCNTVRADGPSQVPPNALGLRVRPPEDGGDDMPFRGPGKQGL
jgi:hypothetical protein